MKNCVKAPGVFCSRNKCDQGCGLYLKQHELEGKPVENHVPRPYEVRDSESTKTMQNKCWLP